MRNGEHRHGSGGSELGQKTAEATRKHLNIVAVKK